METNKLIQRLSHLDPPNRILLSYRTRFFRWMVAAFFSTLVGVAVFGFRPDLHAVAFTPNFLIQAGLLLLASVFSALTAFAFSIPGETGKGSAKLVAVSLSLWVLFLIVSLLLSGNVSAGIGLSCIRDILVLGIIPGILLFTMIRAAAPFRSRITGFLTMLSVAGLGALGTQFICKNDNPLHVLLWHFLPVFLVGVAGIFLGRIFYRQK